MTAGLSGDFNAAQVPLSETLIGAIKVGKLETVKGLLQRGVDVNTCDEYGNSALMWAVTEGAAEIVMLLIENNADPDIENKFGSTAENGAKNRHPELLEILQEAPEIRRRAAEEKARAALAAAAERESMQHAATAGKHQQLRKMATKRAVNFIKRDI